MADTASGVLKEFLVAIGFQVDAASSDKFTATLAGATLKAVELGAAAEAAATAVVAAVAKIADGMDKLYFVSQRTNTSVENIQAIGFAAAQMGSSAAAAQSSLENLANFMRSSPAAASLIQSLGVSTTANGKPRDETAILADLGQKFAEMPIYRAQRYASLLGIDQNTLFALINGMGQYAEAYKKMYAAAGLDSGGGAAQAHEFMVQLRELGAAFEILGIKAESVLSGAFAQDIARFREAIVANFGNITDVLVGVGKVIVTIGYGFTGIITTAFDILDKLYKAFLTLSPAQQHFVELTAGVIIAWRALNLAFVFSPIGAVLALAAALLLLYQDYETWKNGGKSLIDWKAWEPAIKNVKEFVKWFSSKDGFYGVFEGFLIYFGSKWLIGVLSVIAKVARALAGLRLPGVAPATVPTALAGDTEAAGGAAVAAGEGLTAATVAIPAAIGIAATAGLVYGLNSSNTSGGQYASPLVAANDRKQEDALNNPRIKQAHDILIGLGWSENAAAGIIANMLAEDGDLDPTRIGDNGEALGIGQWHQDRQLAFAQIFGHPMAQSTFDEQVKFYSDELKGLTGDRGAAAAGKLLSSGRYSAGQDGAIVSILGERPMAQMEAATNRAASAAALSSAFNPSNPYNAKNITINQTTTITAPSSVTAAQLAAHQGKVNAGLARNLNNAVDGGH